MAIPLNALDFELPQELIAQTPAVRRDDSRLLVVNRQRRTLTHSVFRQLGDFLPARSALVRNNARVLPARFRGRREGGGQVECLLLTPAQNRVNSWWCLLRPGRKLREGSGFQLDRETMAKVLDIDQQGRRLVEFALTIDESVTAMANRLGEMPLPPYVRRHGESEVRAVDRERYQTVYAQSDRAVAAAAPTAGLHFTPELIAALEQSGHSFHDVTLHVGPGTFQPIKTEWVNDHPIHHEIYEIPASTRRLLHNGELSRVAIGTTSVRAVEDYLRRPESETRDLETDFYGNACLYLYPPASFAGTDAMITNFHLPRSTLLCLVAAFLDPGGETGLEWLREIYGLAVKERYRFFSYGDAMLIQ